MNQQNIKFLLALLISMLGVKASAHDIAVKNADGVTIYYNFINNRTELEVSSRGSYSGEYSNYYSGNVVIPKSFIDNGTTYSVTRIGNEAFRNCSGLTSITIPNSVTSIGGGAFFDCSGLTGITIPNSVTSIGENAFRGCSGLTSITIPNSVTSIRWNAFKGTAWYDNQPEGLVYAGKVAYKYKGTMPSNTNIVLEEGSLGITDYAFSGCSCLTGITIPNSVTSIGDYAFQGCSGLTNITIPNSVTSIGGFAFQNCSSLTEVNFNATNCTTMGAFKYPVFSGCSSLSTVNIGANVQNIPSCAFSDCTSLTSITISNSVANIGSYAFYNTAWFNNQSNGVVYAGNVVYCYKGNMPSNTNIVLKEGTLGITDYAFSGCSGLTSITIPNSVTSIGYSAFDGCSSLKSITIPNSVTSIRMNAFRSCIGLTNVSIGNSVASIEDYAFCQCSGLTSITMGNSITSIGYSAFVGCSDLTEVHISDLAAWCNIKFYNDYNSNPLYYAKHLYLNGEEISELNIPNSVTSINNYAFNYCTGLTSITIPNSVTSIGDYAFQGCSGLTNVSIGNSVTNIGLQAFQNCDNLLTVKSEIEEPFNCSGRFSSNTLRNGTLYIPAGTKGLYIRFDGWREFLKIEEVGGEQEQYVWLTIKDGRGSTMLKVKKGAAQELAVKPETGWKILTATMDGTDISTQIKSGNVYTTPAIMNDATIKIVYEMDAPSSTIMARESKADIKVVDDGVVISNAEPQSRCVVYSSSGQQIVNTVIEDGSRKITLQKGQVYILTINGRTLKFAL